MNKCPKCGKEDLAAQFACLEESCPFDRSEFISQGEPYLDNMYEPPPDLFESPLRQIKLTGGKIITLNSQQCEALDLIQQWQSDPADLFFVLSGYAGTGKTTIVKESFKAWLKRPGFHKGIGVTAPTHKAKKVISDATGMDSATIQSLLGLRPDVDVADFNPNKPEFSAQKPPKIKEFSWVVLDEGSMLNKPLWDMLKKQALQHHTKLLVMLDEAQLPPVKEDLSPVLIDDDVKYKFQLTKVERQAGTNPLMGIYDAIRGDVHARTDQFQKQTLLIELDDVPGIPEAGIKFLNDRNTFGRLVVEAFGSEWYTYDKNYCKVLCWTNGNVQFWNGSIRKSLISINQVNFTEEQRVHAGTIMPNELLMGYKGYLGGIQNAGEYEVVSMEFCEREITHTRWHDRTKETIAEVVMGYRVSMIDITEGTMVYAFILEPDEESERKFVRIFQSYLFSAKTTRAWPEYFSFKEEVLLLRDLRDKSGGLICGKDLDYAYALTVHKSQGSTYDQVFIDEANINQNPKHVERNKLKYVAFSRPRFLATVYTG